MITAAVQSTSTLFRPVRPVRAVRAVASHAYKVNLKTIDGAVTTLEVGEDQSILEVALESGMEGLPHDCKLGVCMNCAARLTNGTLDQGAGMLRDDIIDNGYALLCVSIPKSDVDVEIIEEEELLAEVMDG